MIGCDDGIGGGGGGANIGGRAWGGGGRGNGACGCGCAGIGSCPTGVVGKGSTEFMSSCGGLGRTKLELPSKFIVGTFGGGGSIPKYLYDMKHQQTA